MVVMNSALAASWRPGMTAIMPPRPRVFTIPASAEFSADADPRAEERRTDRGVSRRRRSAGARERHAVPADAARLRAGARRVSRGARDDAAVLPRIVPLGDIDEDELAFVDAAGGRPDSDVPDELGGLERRMLLAELILRWIASPGMRTGSRAAAGRTTRRRPRSRSRMPRAADRRHDDAAGCVRTSSTSWCRANSMSTGKRPWNFSASRASTGRRTRDDAKGSIRRRGAIC